ncbi:hypothetical protein ABW21_db0206300 [Orbilia brochopaga]|nr:hypothetical protein ABW21_db0206300 [Drechslerella brochopaga]
MFSTQWQTEVFPCNDGETRPFKEWQAVCNLVFAVILGIPKVPKLEIIGARSQFKLFCWKKKWDHPWFLGGERIHTIQSGRLEAKLHSQRVENESMGSKTSLQSTILAAFHATPRKQLRPDLNVVSEISRMINVFCKRPWQILKEHHSDASGKYIELASITLHGQYLHVSKLQIPLKLFKMNLNARIPVDLEKDPLKYQASMEFNIDTVEGRKLAFLHILAIFQEHMAKNIYRDPPFDRIFLGQQEI